MNNEVTPMEQDRIDALRDSVAMLTQAINHAELADHYIGRADVDPRDTGVHSLREAIVKMKRERTQCQSAIQTIVDMAEVK
jgi:hypothetical protein